MRPNLVLLPQESHEAVVLFAGTRGQRGASGASQRVVLLTDGSTGNLSGRTNETRNPKKYVRHKI